MIWIPAPGAAKRRQLESCGERAVADVARSTPA